GDDLRELVDGVRIPFVFEVELLRRDVRIERVDPDAEGQIALELGRRSSQHDAAALLGEAAQLGEQARLADARLALDGDAHRSVSRQRIERSLELLEL